MWQFCIYGRWPGVMLTTLPQARLIYRLANIIASYFSIAGILQVKKMLGVIYDYYISSEH